MVEEKGRGLEITLGLPTVKGQEERQAEGQGTGTRMGRNVPRRRGCQELQRQRGRKPKELQNIVIGRSLATLAMDHVGRGNSEGKRALS